DHDRLVVRVVAVRVPPRAMECPRRERRDVRVQEGALVPGPLVDGVEGSELGAKVTIGSRGSDIAGWRTSRARTVRVCLERGGHAARIPPDTGFPCARNLSSRCRSQRPNASRAKGRTPTSIDGLRV